ncbi:hypothetical protein CFR75_15370 [Komagataeibacter xylinus]|uniref:DUF969 family protein n=2 Tax=Komagataeibacter TaxID=1434011 RepID=A0A850P3Q0_9PROT|nr:MULTISPECIES: DUF969 family protein [Komagataeibacter]AZV40517.1 DUF969 domain-containing protein [Komagataeibacter xylinus]NVN38344.1 DUF969 family protein [Komagataeibacter swingsii]PYD55643.1 hypothetical protein CFR75_15370 [Komagataeibacter xylinus]GBQ68576.1 hypothetical protein AA15237_0422 [Komagataeibacter xylinus NBRC 15237]
MQAHPSLLTLFGLAVIVIGVGARINIMLVIILSALTTCLCSGVSLVTAIATIGHYFTANRYMTILWSILPLVGLLEHAGLPRASRTFIGRLGVSTPGHVLWLYFLLRQISAALGLTSLGGQAQMVRPLLAPMVEEAGERMGRRAISEELSQKLKAEAAAVDNIAVFFGEDIFLAVASILLMETVLENAGLRISPWHLSFWAIPSALMAAIVTYVRMKRLDQAIGRRSEP